MSEAARAHMNHTADALKGHGASISPAEKALIYPGLAQAEATIVLRRKGPVDTCEYEASERPRRCRSRWHRASRTTQLTPPGAAVIPAGATS